MAARSADRPRARPLAHQTGNGSTAAGFRPPVRGSPAGRRMSGRVVFDTTALAAAVLLPQPRTRRLARRSCVVLLLVVCVRAGAEAGVV